MPNYTPEDLQLALTDVQNGLSMRKAANRNKVPYSTLRDRLCGTESHTVAAESQQRLSKVLERKLCDWLIFQDKLGMALMHSQIRKLVISLLGEEVKERPLGKRWMEGFLRRNPRIKTLRAKPIDSKRLKAANPAAIRRFFEILVQPRIRGIPPRNRWNFDETGFFQALGINGLVVGQSELRSTIKAHPSNRHWSTVIEAISATGKCLNPLVVFKGKNVQQQWFPEDMDYLTNWNFTASDKGWTNNAIGLKWLEDIFIPGSKTELPNEKRLLILDGHGSHATPDFMRLCVLHKIQLVYLPAHTSHVLQPLDISVFGPLKTVYRAEVNLANHLHPNSPIGKETFLSCYFRARKKALITDNAVAGWKGSGLWPLNIEKPLNSRFVREDPSQTITVQPASLSPARANRRSRSLEFATPKTSKDVQQLVRSQNKVKSSSPTTRRLFRTWAKSLDTVQLEIAQLKDRVQTLEEQQAQSKPRKRAAVEADLNELFVSIQNVRDVRRRLDPSDSEGLE